MIMGHRINSGLSSLQRVLHVKWGEKMYRGIEVGSIDAESDGLGLNLGSTSVTPGKLQ